ncbi:rhodanese-like domain-containing protein [Salisediminibacterium selenitireducens]|uniref:Rhodanese domain protein n=1 Tax=Bacillus selenitireducens (strain ATCC 700615 / DSM 15326 / MLS10) TaxID=439292 RepID=D6XY50_BACIE|nr:rhodanese-like domain-containing protein [Salisediminibacterium selenitireducens]ADH98123.1 Rhodanese domain protein [[Bacillus] selenitireducens MLS10]
MKTTILAIPLLALLLSGCSDNGASDAAFHNEPEQTDNESVSEPVPDEDEIRFTAGAAYFNRLTTNRYMLSEDDIDPADSGTWLIDLRNSAAFSEGSLPEAVSSDPASLGDVLGALRQTDQVVFISEDGQVASQVMAATRMAGINSSLLAGGIRDYKGDLQPGQRSVSELLDTVEEAPGGDPETQIMDEVVNRYLSGDIATDRSRVDPETLHANLSDYYIIDTRSEADYKEAHVPTAHHIPVASIGQHMPDIPADKPLLVYCYSGQTGAQAATVLAVAGFETYTLTGGMGNWVQQGFETAQPEADPVTQ